MSARCSRRQCLYTKGKLRPAHRLLTAGSLVDAACGAEGIRPVMGFGLMVMLRGVGLWLGVKGALGAYVIQLRVKPNP